MRPRRDLAEAVKAAEGPRVVFARACLGSLTEEAWPPERKLMQVVCYLPESKPLTLQTLIVPQTVD